MIGRQFRLLAGALLLGAVSTQTIVAETATLQLLDRSQGSPIVGAVYTIGGQTGITGSQGTARFTRAESDTLFLSHVTYGKWHLTDAKLDGAIESGVAYRLNQTILLQPVTVVALRPGQGIVEELGLGTQDRLSHDAGTVLSQVTAISGIQKSGGYGFDPVLRGFKYDQLNVVIDGAQCATAACPNRMDPPTSQIALNMVDEIEILKGPHALRYGPSFGGTINFQSTRPQFVDESDTYGRLSTSAESNDGAYRSEGLIGVRGSAYDIALLGAYSQGNDYQDGSGVTVPASFRRASYGATVSVRPSTSQLFTLSATHNRANDTRFAALPMDLRSDKTWLLNLRHEARVEGERLDTWNTTAYLTRVDHMMDNLEKVLAPRMLNATTDAETVNLGMRTEGIWSLDPIKLYTGMSLRLERAEGDRSRDFLIGPMKGRTVGDNVWNGCQIFRGGLFAELHRSYDSARMVVSGRLDYTDATARNLDPDFASRNQRTNRSEFNPSISLGGLRYLDNGISIGLWLGRAQRSASLTESYINSLPVGADPYEMLGNPSLNPEINNQIDLTFCYRTSRTSLDISIFSAFLQDYISSEIDPNLTPKMPSNPGVRRYANIASALMTGFEASWVQQLTRHFEQKTSLAYTYGKNKTLNEPLPEIAPLDIRYSISGRFLNDKLQPVVSLRKTLEQGRISTAFGETETPSFTVMDMAITYHARKGVQMSAGIRNLFDETYFEHLSRPVRGQNRAIFSAGRSGYLMLALDTM